jgi:hypothetical protein
MYSPLTALRPHDSSESVALDCSPVAHLQCVRMGRFLTKHAAKKDSPHERLFNVR